MRRLMALLLLLALLASCAGPADPPAAGDNPGQPTAGDNPGQPADATPAPGPADQPADGPVTISFAADEIQRSIYESLAKKFMSDNPTIKVVIVPIEDLTNVQFPDGQYNPLSVLRSVVSGADAAPSTYVYIPPEAYGANLLMDLKPLMDADPAFKPEDFYPGALEQYTVDGATWLLPRYLNIQILTYNKELFKLNNLPEPKPEWTWNDLIGAAQQIGKPGGLNATYGFFDPTGGSAPLSALLQDRDIDLFNTPPKDVRLDRPEIVDTVKRLRELNASNAIYNPGYKQGPRPIDGPGGPGEDPTQLIRDGRIGIWGSEFIAVDYGPEGPRPAQPLPFATGKAPYPDIGNLFSGGNDGYFISSGSQHPQETWKWIEFLSRQQIDQPGPNGPMPGFNQPGRVPARESLAEQSGFWKDIDAETAAVYKWTIAHPAKQPARAPDYTAISVLSQTVAQLVGDKKLDPAKALAEAQRNLEQQIAQVQLTPTPTVDASPVLVATPEPQEAPAGATTITFEVNGYNPSDLRRIARDFGKQHPEIFVKIRATQVFTEAPSLERLAQTADCFSWPSLPQSDAEFKALLDLQPLFDADAAFPRDDFPTALLSAYQHEGGLFGLPYTVNLRTLNYNKNAFAAAGAQPPTGVWKPADFLAAAQALTKGDGDKQQFGYVPTNGAIQDMMFFIGQFGGRLTKGSGDDTRANFDDPKVVEAIQWYLDLSKVHKIMPPLKFSYKRDDPGFEDKSYEYAMGGRAGMWFAQGPMFGFVGPIKGDTGAPETPQINFEEGIAALPVGGAGLRSGDFYARGFHISARTQHAQACWEWLKFLSADASPNLLQGGIPARTSAAQSEAFTKQAQPGQVDIYKAYADALKRPSQPGDDPNALYGRIDLYWFYKAIDATLTKGADLGKGLAEARKTTDAFLDCVAKSGTPPKTATCANQVDPGYQGYTIEDPQEGPPGIGIPRG